MTTTFPGGFEDLSGREFLHETATLVRKGWCCGAEARDYCGVPVAASDPAATAWSLTGALARVSGRRDATLGAQRRPLGDLRCDPRLITRRL